MLEKAIKKLEKEFSAGKYDRYAQAMKAAVKGAVVEFCGQSEEFAQAVAQGGSFEDCMKAVAKGCGSSMSDLEAYRRAAQFYFPGSDVRFEIHIDLAPHAEDEDPTHSRERDTGKAVVLNLADFL